MISYDDAVSTDHREDRRQRHKHTCNIHMETIQIYRPAREGATRCSLFESRPDVKFSLDPSDCPLSQR